MCVPTYFSARNIWPREEPGVVLRSTISGRECGWVVLPVGVWAFLSTSFFFVFTLSPKRLGTYMHLVGMIASLTAASRPVTYLMFVVRRLGTSWRGEGGRELSRGHVL